MFNKRKVYKYKFCRLVGIDLWGYYYKNDKKTKIKTFLGDQVKNRQAHYTAKKSKSAFTYSLALNQKVEKRFKRRTRYFAKLMNQQKFRKYYANLSLNQIKRTLKLVAKKNYNLLDHFMFYFEMRLDSVLVRSNFAYSFPHARQIIKHGFINVNGSRVNVTSFMVSPGDVIEICDSKKEYLFNVLSKRLRDLMVLTSAPEYLDVDYSLMSLLVIARASDKNVPYLEHFDVSKLLDLV